MSEYMPTTDEVQGIWNAMVGNTESFDRWLAEVKAQAWDEGYVSSDDYYGEHDNPYQGENK
jgi:hypothetical protein